MVEAIFQGNGTARIVGQRKYAAKQRSEEHGGSLLFAPESKEAFEEVTPGIVCTDLQERVVTLCCAGLWLQEAASQGVPLPEFSEVEVAVTPVVVAGKSSL